MNCRVAHMHVLIGSESSREIIGGKQPSKARPHSSFLDIYGCILTIVTKDLP